jgi:hypothetical protein
MMVIAELVGWAACAFVHAETTTAPASTKKRLRQPDLLLILTSFLAERPVTGERKAGALTARPCFPG